MRDQIHFSNWPGVDGVLGGILIAVLVPLFVLLYGGVLTQTMQLILSSLAVIVGAVVTVISAVVGMSMPSTIRAFRQDIPECCREESSPFEAK